MKRAVPWILAGSLWSCGGSAEGDSSSGGASGAGAAAGGSGGAVGGSGGASGSTGGSGGASGSTGGSGGTVAGSGGSAGSVAGAGGSGGGAGGSGGSGGVVPEHCRVPTSEPGPHSVTFRFLNHSDGPVYLLEECRLQFDVTACADGYAEPLTIAAFCSTPCSDSTDGCIVCGACAYQGVAVVPGTVTGAEWSGHTFTFSETSAGCSCHETHTAPSARYRIRVPVWETAEAAASEPPARTVSVDFAITDGVVDVPLGP